jgi:glyoxylase-like metal-dependent hydrolase (beta-lactamase superfamily II)
MEPTFPVADGIDAIDTRMLGRYLLTSAYLIRAAEPALIETGPATSAPAVVAGLRELGIDPGALAHLIVTHIHLDHAGGVGTLASAFPHATIWVHGRGAPHLVDPTKLVAGTIRAYGGEHIMQRYGEVIPAPADRVRAIGEGDTISLGNRTLEVFETPGHASHQVCVVDADTGAAFTGDALGVHIPDVRVLRPAVPPPDCDVDAGVASMRRIHERARLLLLSHFGAVHEVDELCELAEKRLLAWSETVRRAVLRSDDLDRIERILAEQGAQEYLDDSGRPIDMERYDVLSSIRMNAAGLARYWERRTPASVQPLP